MMSLYLEKFFPVLGEGWVIFIVLVKFDTLSVPNYKSFQLSWRVKTILNLTKIIERIINIYDIK